MKNTHLLLIVATVAVLLVSLFVGTRSISLHIVADLEQGDMVRDVARVTNVLADELLQLQAIAGDYADWDDAYAFVRNGNQTFITSSLNSSLHDRLRLNLMVYLNRDGTIVYGRSYDAHHGQGTSLQPSLLTHLQQGKPLLSHGTTVSSFRGILQLPEGLMLVASRPVLTSNSQGPVRGTLVVGRYLNAAETARLSGLTTLTLQFRSAAEMARSSSLQALQQELAGNTGGVLVKRLNEERIVGVAQLRDIYGDDAGFLQVEEPRTMYRSYKEAAGNVHQLYFATTAVFLVLFTLVARQLVIARRHDRQREDTLEARVMERTEALVQAHEQMKRVSFELIWAEERERERIAGELRDQIGQSLLLAKMKLDTLADRISSDPHHAYAVKASTLIETSIREIRSLTFRVRPPILDTAGIETTLQWLCSSIGNDYPLEIEFTDDGQSRSLSAEVRHSLYHAVRELLMNVVKHARTERAQLSIAADNTVLVVQVVDHGVGFNQADVHDKHVNNGGYGLYNVRQRVAQVGGLVTLASAPGRGTSVTVMVPLMENDPETGFDQPLLFADEPPCFR